MKTKIILFLSFFCIAAFNMNAQNEPTKKMPTKTQETSKTSSPTSVSSQTSTQRNSVENQSSAKTTNATLLAPKKPKGPKPNLVTQENESSAAKKKAVKK